jgi:hypothetical protein
MFMQVESIQTVVQHVHNKVRTRIYTTVVDNNNKQKIEMVDYYYTPIYNKSGNLEIVETDKGNHIDTKS